MICKECGSARVLWFGPLSDLQHTECEDCGAWNSQWSEIMEEFLLDEEPFRDD